MELPGNDKARLRAEEIFRHEVRAELRKKPSSNKVIDFLQTSLGNILITTVAVGIVSTIWGISTTAYTERKERNKLATELDKEIEYRIFQLCRQYARDSTYYADNGIENDSLAKHWGRWKMHVLAFKKASTKEGFQYLYQQFEAMNTISLMIQLADLESDNRKSAEIKNAASIVASNIYLPPRIESNKEFNELAQKLKNGTRIIRWRQYFGSGTN